MDFLAPVKHLRDMLYPETCMSCHRWLVQGEMHFCMHCSISLPRTYFTFQKQNPVERLFWGRIPFDFAGAFLYYHEKGMVRELLHRIKYRGARELAVSMGRLYAEDLLKTNPDFRPGMLIPVPLHPRKERQRGYNQAFCIAQGMAEVIRCEVRTDIVLRKHHSQTQTRRGRYDRWMNVEDIFSVVHPGELEMRHVVFVDDVITTGATLEACISAASGIRGMKTGILSLALARN